MITTGKVKEFGKKRERILRKTDEINNLIEDYKKMESMLIDNGSYRNDIVELWFKCLIDLNNKITKL